MGGRRREQGKHGAGPGQGWGAELVTQTRVEARRWREGVRLQVCSGLVDGLVVGRRTAGKQGDHVRLRWPIAHPQGEVRQREDGSGTLRNAQHPRQKWECC